tara:strand:- start:254 stop:481 length:228 start_codon:yes stop_codon:yes gene_type:complete
MTDKEKINALITAHNKLRTEMIMASGQLSAMSEWHDGSKVGGAARWHLATQDFKKVETGLDKALKEDNFDKIIFG